MKWLIHKEKLFFSEEKKRKTFTYCRWRKRHVSKRIGRSARKKVKSFWFFSSENEHSSYCFYSPSALLFEDGIPSVIGLAMAAPR